MIEPDTLPATVDEVKIGGNTYFNVPLYGTTQDAAKDYNQGMNGFSVIPAENAVATSVWTGTEEGAFTTVALPNPDAPGARPSMAVMGNERLRPYHDTFYEQYDQRSYVDAYERATGRPAPGILPVIIPFIPLILKLIAIVIAVVIVAAVLMNVLMYAIDKDTEVTQEPVLNPDGTPSEWTLVCKGNTCQYFNAATGETKDGPSSGSVLSKILIPVVAVVVVGVGAYAAVKIIGASGSPRRA